MMGDRELTKFYRSILKKRAGADTVTVLGYYEWGYTFTYKKDHAGAIVGTVEKIEEQWHEGAPPATN